MPKGKDIRHPQGISPLGIIVWAWLAKPQPAFEDKGENKFSLTIALDPNDEKTKAWATSIQALTKFKGKPWKIDEESGQLYVTFRTLRQAKAFDSQGQPLPEGEWPGKGSKVKVAYVPNEYAGFGGGINLYLQGVQVIEMVKGFTPDVSFPKEEGGYVPDQVSKHPAPDGSAAPAQEDENLPF